MKKAIKSAFPVTIPVMLGYVSVGIAFGLLLEKSGYNFLWAILMSILIYAGSMQFIAINLLTCGAGLIEIALMTLFVNIRHVFYGLSFIESFKEMGKKKTYMIFSLTDETYSLLCASKAPEGVNNNQFMFFISLFNQIYWIIGSAIGSIAGSLITFNTRGIDFAMTALFVVIFIEQWSTYKNHTPVLIGACSTILSLILFGPSNLILPSMIFISITLMVFQKQIEGKNYGVNKGEVSNEC
ncbi:AzlC family ABC transporter permease [Clostridium folliculivorans]|uniref:Branched-chain amino acid transporter AzlC n=1 Tax=Clostridium folliculivorans TaxID=2886038 RepID=A0A9W5Y1J5_9CLOT|nr:AzlC family ABC transporter permease [Clostridium folliculivorans]GKU24996.1 branched-chain amino acid transporter AzlC [Clostridium folliculivorans]GKU31094.1 branched-chain amino acid transporter AzlC [Clostridium folliculivorans]